MGCWWVLIRGWALINFFCLLDGCLFKVGANLRLGAYLNKYYTWRKVGLVGRVTLPSQKGHPSGQVNGLFLM